MTQVLDQTIGDNFAAYHGDCIDIVRGLADESVHFSIFSPPFASLYTYSASPRDIGNCADDAGFFSHMRYLIPELIRVTKPGRLLSFHCMLLPTTRSRDGHIGLKDFRGALIAAFVECGWIFHSEVSIWKDPVTAMQRTKALGLLHKQIRKDSAMSRQGINDFLVTMRRPGDNPDPIPHSTSEFPVEMWQRYASPVWAVAGGVDDDGLHRILPDIAPNDTLQYRSARDDADERHICPLQLPIIRRAIRLWTNAGDTVLSPFMGIGSEGVVAIEEGRRFVGAELKDSYFAQASANLKRADNPPQQALFG